ncbi:MAG: glutaredoxin domain-containing protein [Acidobacteriota bacterium]
MIRRRAALAAQRRIALGWLPAAVVVLVLVVGSLPAAGDVLILSDGTRLEVEGPIEVRGRQVIFHDERGRLRSARLDEVDLEATEAANTVEVADASDSPPEKEAGSDEAAAEDGDADETVAPVLVLTNRDIARAAGPPVTMYSTTWCGVCSRARLFLEQLEVDVVELDIEANREAAFEKNRKSPDCGVPVLDIGGTVLCGFDPQAIRAALKLGD